VACLAAFPKVFGQCDPVAEKTLMQYITQTASQVVHGRPKVQFVGSTTSSEDCKFQAFKSLAKIATSDSESVVSFMLNNILFTYTEDNGLEYWQEPQHMPAVDCLVQLGKVGRPDVIESLLVQLGTDGMHVDHRVLRALRRLTNSGNAKVINALLRFMPGFHCMEGIDYNGEVVDEAYATLKHIVEPCDKHAICEVVGTIADPNMWKDAYEAVERATHDGHVQGIRLDFWNDSSGDERNCDGGTSMTESQVQSSSSSSDSIYSASLAPASRQLSWRAAVKTPTAALRSMKASPATASSQLSSSAAVKTPPARQRSMKASPATASIQLSSRAAVKTPPAGQRSMNHSMKASPATAGSQFSSRAAVKTPPAGQRSVKASPATASSQPSSRSAVKTGQVKKVLKRPASHVRRFGE